ncbi:Twinfilin-1 [Phlyctochytrium bullatum]|nr:Twinfilin-1 [Phlyctochytrium bullatum]
MEDVERSMFDGGGEGMAPTYWKVEEVTTTDDLITAFKQAGDTVRALQIVIQEESLVVRNQLLADGAWEDAFASVQTWLEPTAPSYVLFRLETRTITEERGWLVIQYVPDRAKVREKMLYASTKATLTKELGASNFVDFLHATALDEVSYESYVRHLKHKEADAPLTEKEQEEERVRQTEVGADIGASTRKTNAASIGFPFDDDAKEAIAAFGRKESQLVLITIDIANEVMKLAHTKPSFDFAELAGLADPLQPYFVLLRQSGTEEAVFAYICPPKSKVKERMLYSSSKASFLAYCEAEFGLTFGVKTESDNVDELKESVVAPAAGESGVDAGDAAAAAAAPKTKLAFAKPARPGRR